MPGWLWRLRWMLGGRMLTWAARLLPPGPLRNDLARRVSWWSKDWCHRIDRQRELTDEVKRTTAAWQASKG